MFMHPFCNCVVVFTLMRLVKHKLIQVFCRHKRQIWVAEELMPNVVETVQDVFFVPFRFILQYQVLPYRILPQLDFLFG